MVVDDVTRLIEDRREDVVDVVDVVQQPNDHM